MISLANAVSYNCETANIPIGIVVYSQILQVNIRRMLGSRAYLENDQTLGYVAKTGSFPVIETMKNSLHDIGNPGNPYSAAEVRLVLIHLNLLWGQIFLYHLSLTNRCQNRYEAYWL